MSAASIWQDTNNRYLADRMAWLRGRLEQHARLSRPRPAPVGPQPPESERSKSFWKGLLRKDSANASAKRTQFSSPSQASRIERKPRSRIWFRRIPRTHLQAPGAHHSEPAVSDLQLSNRTSCCSCAAMELDTGIGALCSYARTTRPNTVPYLRVWHSPFLTIRLGCDVPDVRFAMAADETHQPGGHALNTSSLRADETESSIT